MQLHLKTLTGNDAEAACAVVRRSITECCAGDHQNNTATIDAWLTNKTPDNFRVWLSSLDAIALGAYLDCSLVGVALVSGSTLALCYVVPEVLHRGVGKRLLSEAEVRAVSAGIKVLDLESTRTADSFYRRNGFLPEGPVQSWAGLEAQPMCKRLIANSSSMERTPDGAPRVDH